MSSDIIAKAINNFKRAASRSSPDKVSAKSRASLSPLKLSRASTSKRLSRANSIGVSEPVHLDKQDFDKLILDLRSKDEDEIEEALRTLSRACSQQDTSNTSIILPDVVVPVSTHLLTHSNHDVCGQAAVLLGKVSGLRGGRNALIENKSFDMLIRLLVDSKNDEVKVCIAEGVFQISIYSDGCRALSQVPDLVETLAVFVTPYISNADDFSLWSSPERKAIVYILDTIANISKSVAASIGILIESKVVQTLCTFLTNENVKLMVGSPVPPASPRCSIPNSPRSPMVSPRATLLVSRQSTDTLIESCFSILCLLSSKNRNARKIITDTTNIVNCLANKFVASQHIGVRSSAIHLLLAITRQSNGKQLLSTDSSVVEALAKVCISRKYGPETGGLHDVDEHTYKLAIELIRSAAEVKEFKADFTNHVIENYSEEAFVEINNIFGDTPLSKLRFLNLAHHGIKDSKFFGEHIQYLDLHLDLSYNRLTEFVQVIPRLQQLVLSHNKLIRVPPLSGLRALRELRLDNNSIAVSATEHFFDQFMRCPQLRIIDVSNNLLEMTPSKLQQGAKDLSRLEHLEEVYLYSNPFCTFCAEYQVFFITACKRIRHLDDVKVTNAVREKCGVVPLLNKEEYDGVAESRKGKPSILGASRFKKYDSIPHISEMQNLIDNVFISPEDASTFLSELNDKERIIYTSPKDKHFLIFREDAGNNFSSIKEYQRVKLMKEDKMRLAASNFVSGLTMLAEKTCEVRAMALRCLSKLLIVSVANLGELCFDGLARISRSTSKNRQEITDLLVEFLVPQFTNALPEDQPSAEMTLLLQGVNKMPKNIVLEFGTPLFAMFCTWLQALGVRVSLDQKNLEFVQGLLTLLATLLSTESAVKYAEEQQLHVIVLNMLDGVTPTKNPLLYQGLLTAAKAMLVRGKLVSQYFVEHKIYETLVPELRMVMAYASSKEDVQVVTYYDVRLRTQHFFFLPNLNCSIVHFVFPILLKKHWKTAALSVEVMTILGQTDDSILAEILSPKYYFCFM